MSLPKIDAPLLKIMIPSLKRDANFRPFRRSDEKILLLARESDDPLAWVEAVHQVVTNCSLEVDVDDMTGFDLEYVFIKLRASSIGNKEVVSYRDADGALYEVEIDLAKVEVVFPDSVSDLIEIGDDAKMKLRWPSAQTWVDPDIIRAINAEDALDALVARSIERVWVGEETFDPATSPTEDVVKFIDTLDVGVWKKMREWVGTIPHLSYWVEWTNSQGEHRRFELRTLTDFFTFSSRGED